MTSEELSTDLEAIGVRESEVEQNDGGFAGELPCRSGRRRPLHVVAFGGERAEQASTDRFVVLDHEDPSHVASLRRPELFDFGRTFLAPRPAYRPLKG